MNRLVSELIESKWEQKEHGWRRMNRRGWPCADSCQTVTVPSSNRYNYYKNSVHLVKIHQQIYDRSCCPPRTQMIYLILRLGKFHLSALAASPIKFTYVFNYFAARSHIIAHKNSYNPMANAIYFSKIKLNDRINFACEWNAGFFFSCYDQTIAFPSVRHSLMRYILRFVVHLISSRSRWPNENEATKTECAASRR